MTKPDHNKPLVWLTGASGQLGTTLLRLFPEPETFTWVTTTRSKVDLTSYPQVARFLREHKPDLMVNTAAYTDVDGAEQLPEEELFRANVLCMMQVHSLAPEMSLVQISSDYVFGRDEQREIPYDEEDVAGPVNRYGDSKFELEQYLLANHESSYILRTSWLYGPMKWSRRNFYRSIRRRAEAGEPIRCVTDEVGCPTSTLTLARVIVHLVSDLYSDKDPVEVAPYGLYNVTDLGEVSRLDLARAILERLPGDASRTPIEPITQADLALAAARPHYSALTTTKLSKYHPDLLRPWEEALEEVIDLDNSQER